MQGMIKLVVCAVVLSFCLAAPEALSQLADTPWPIYQHDIFHSGKSPYSGPSSANLTWEYEAGGTLSAPVIDNEGTIYAGGSDAKLYAIKADGTLKWKFEASGNASCATIGGNGNIYFCSRDGVLYALKSDGLLSWKYSAGYSSYITSPTVDNSGNVYFGSNEKKIYALSTTGSLNWAADVLGNIQGTAAIGEDGTIYFTTNAKTKLYAFNPNGSLKWKYDIDDRDTYITSPVVGSDGVVYFGTGWYDNKVYAINSNGTLKWKYNIGSGFVDITGTPALDTDGTLYFGSKDDCLYGINSNGLLKWKFETGGDITCSPVVDQEGTIYLGSLDGKLYALNPDASTKWIYTKKDYNNFYNIAIGEDGALYISSGRKIKAFTQISTEPPDLAISDFDISFDPASQVVRGSKVEVLAVIHEQSNLANANFDISFYHTSKSNLIGTLSRYILAGTTTTAKMTWNTNGLEAGSYQIIAEIKNATPSENNLSNNEAQSNYTLLPNLQDRIDAAVDGDTIWVEAGTFYEHITLRNKIVVKSVAGYESTIIDGSGTGDVVSAPYLDPSAVLDGFTIRNGSTGINIERGGVTIIHNKISGNGRGLWMIGSFVYSDPIIRENLFAGNSGKAIDTNNSWAQVINNTIVNNGSGVDGYGYYSPSPTYKNCIIWGNGDDLTRTAAATYSCIEDGDVGTGNISADPIFADPANGDYHLQADSPCIDSGDPASPRDLDGTRADMGAFCFDQSASRAKITGTISDAATGQPIAYVKVILSGVFEDTLLSDTSGKYLFIAPPDTAYTLNVFAINYPPTLKKHIMATVGDTTVVNFNLTRNVIAPTLYPPKDLAANYQEQSKTVQLTWSSPSEELAFDDGQFEECIGFRGTQGILANGPFVPSEYPSKIELVRMCFSGERAGDNVQVLVYIDPAGTATKPSGSLLKGTSAQVAIAGTGAYQEIDLRSLNLTVNSGKFFIGIMQLSSDPIWLALDETSPDGHAFYGDLNGNFSALTDANLHGVFAIRAIVTKTGSISQTFAAQAEETNKEPFKIQQTANVSSEGEKDLASHLVVKRFEQKFLSAGKTNANAPMASGIESAIGYNIYRSESSPVRIEPTSKIASVNAMAKLYNDTSTVPSKMYWYVVTATYPQGESTPSNEVMVDIPQCYWADLDCDGDVDIVDIQLVAAKWNTSCGNAGYDSLCDIDGDCDIDVVDIQRVAGQWGWPNAQLAKNFSKVAAKDDAHLPQNLTLRINPKGCDANGYHVVEVVVDQIAHLGAFQFDLVYNNNSASIKDVLPGDTFCNSPNKTMTLGPVIDQTTGRLTFGAFSYGAEIGNSGSAVLARITFASKLDQEQPVKLENVKLTDQQGDLLPVSKINETGIGGSLSPTVPKSFFLGQNYPNPFNPTTAIYFGIPNQSGRSVKVSLAIYNLKGQLIRTILDEDRRAGYYTVEWNGTNDMGQQVSSGIYFYVMTVGDYRDTKKMIFAR